MALSFDTPSRLERRIAQDMLDDSDDLSLPGLGRRAPLEASYSALSESTFEEPHDEDEDEDPTQLTPAANRSNNRTTASSRTSTTATARPPATLASVLAQSEQTGQTTATPRSTGSSSRTQAQRTQSHRAPSPNRSSVSSDSSMFTDRPRSPPLTSTPQGSSVGMRTQGTIMSQHSDGTSRFNLANRVTASAAAAAANDSRGRMGLANRSGNGSTTTSRWGESQNLSARSRHSSLREGETNRDESQYLSRLATRSVGDFSLSTGSIKSDPNQSMGGSRSARDVEVIDQPNSDPVLSSPVEVQKGAEADAEGATAPVADETAASERNDSQQGHSQDNATGTMHTSDIAPSFNINNARMAPSSAFRDLLPGSPADRSASLRGDTSQDDMSISSAKRDQNRHLEGEPTPRSNKSAPIHDSSRSSDSLSHDSSRSTRAGNRARTLATAAYNRPASALDYASEHTDGERDLPDLSRSRSDGEHDESTDGRSTPSNREMLPASSPYRRPRSQAIVSSLDSPKPQAFAPGWRRPPRTSAFRESSLAEEDQATESDASAGQDTPTSTAPRQQSAQSHIMQEPPGAESEADTLDATSSPSARAQKRLAVLTDVATPRQTPSQTAADIERRKAFLLNSVRATNSLLHRHKARSGSVRGTPISGRGFREGSMAPSDAGASTGDSSGVLGPLNTVGAGRTPVPRGVLGRPVADTDSFASETSSNDLTVPIGGGMRANTSFPGIGAADQASGGSALGRVDPQKLARYQQKINSQLEEENVALRGEKDALTRNLNKALRDLEFLRKRTPGNEGTDGELSAATSSANLPLSPSDEAHARGMHRVGRRSDSEHGDASTSAKVEGATAEELAAAQTRIAELDNEAQELADALDEREAELAQVRKELADAQVERTRAPLHGGDAEDAEDVVRDLQNQPFDLKDQLAEANRVRTQQEEELKRLQAALESAQHQGEASRHDQGDEELRAQIDGLEEAVRARNTDIEALEASAAEAQNRFDAQITQLREQVETHCDELEERLSGERQEARDAEAEAKQRARDLQDVLDEREMQLQRARTERDEALRQHNNDDAAAELTRLQDRIGELSDELTRAKQDARRAHEKADELSALETQMSEREATLKQTASSLGDAQARVQELEQNLEDLQEQERLNARDVQDYQEANAELERQLDELEAEARRTQEELMQEREQLQSALQQAERRAHEARVEMVELRTKIEVQDGWLEDERAEVRKLTAQVLNQDRTTTQHPRQSSGVAEGSDADRVENEARLAELESELDTANREVGRLRVQLASPARRAQVELKDLEIGQLRAQKAELEEHLGALREQNLSFSTIQAAATPRRPGFQQGTPAKGSPLPKSILALKTPMRTPRTPGELSEMSWLYHDSTLGEAGVLEQIASLQRQLDLANESIDDKLEKLENAGLGPLTLAEQLARARARIAELENELANLVGKDGLLDKSRIKLCRIRCPGCEMRFDANKQVGLGAGDVSELHTSHSSTMHGSPNKSYRSAQRLDRVIAEVNSQLAELKAKWEADRGVLAREKAEIATREKQWQDERQTLAKENAALRDAASKANAGASGTAKGRNVAEKEATLREHAAVYYDLERAREATRDLDRELKEEQQRLHVLSRESHLTAQEQADVESRLARTQEELSAVKAELAATLERYEELSAQLLERSRGAGDLQLQLAALKDQVARAKAQVDALRKEKADILGERAQLHQRFVEANMRTENFHQELAASREALLSRQAQLDEQIAQIERLRATLDARDKEMHRLAGDRDRLRSQRSEILAEVSGLEADLRRVRVESQRFGRDLEAFREERDQHLVRQHSEADHVRAEADAQLGRMARQLEKARASLEHAETELARHQCTTDAAAQLDEQRTWHAQECKGLMLQIRYLKAKFMRESDLRADLGHQKGYLQQLIGGLELSEKATLALIADLGLSRGTPRPPPASPFKHAALAVRAIARMSLMAKRWKETCTIKGALRDAHMAARARRAERSEA